MKSVVYFFTGTGNSLEVANALTEALPNCTLLSMGKDTHDSEVVYDTIGFVYPTYAYNAPLRVKQFLQESSFERSKRAYFFAVTTCGGKDVSALPVVAKLLKHQGITLDFAEAITMVRNAVVYYKMDEKNAEIQQTASRKIPELVHRIIAKEQQHAAKLNVPLNTITALYQKTTFPNKDRHYNVSDSCTDCKICVEICPVSNIETVGKRPSFNHHCEQCLACLQWCPSRAINFKNKTQERGRYQNPNVSLRDLAKGNACSS